MPSHIKRLCIALRADIRRAQSEKNREWEHVATQMLRKYENQGRK